MGLLFGLLLGIVSQCYVSLGLADHDGRESGHSAEHFTGLDEDCDDEELRHSDEDMTRMADNPQRIAVR